MQLNNQTRVSWWTHWQVSCDVHWCVINCSMIRTTDTISYSSWAVLMLVESISLHTHRPLHAYSSRRPINSTVNERVYTSLSAYISGQRIHERAAFIRMTYEMVLPSLPFNELVSNLTQKSTRVAARWWGWTRMENVSVFAESSLRLVSIRVDARDSDEAEVSVWREHEALCWLLVRITSSGGALVH